MSAGVTWVRVAREEGQGPTHNDGAQKNLLDGVVAVKVGEEGLRREAQQGEEQEQPRELDGRGVNVFGGRGVGWLGDPAARGRRAVHVVEEVRAVLVSRQHPDLSEEREPCAGL